MLKRLAATGIAAAGVAGTIMLANPANAESLTVKHNCYPYGPYPVLAAYCQPYPGYNIGWHRWHYWHHYNPWNPYRFHGFHH